MKKLPASILASQDEVVIPGKTLEFYDGAGSVSTFWGQNYEFPDQAGPSGAIGVFSAPPVWVSKPFYIDICWRPATDAAGTLYWDVKIGRNYNADTFSAWDYEPASVKGTTNAGSAKMCVTTCLGGTMPSNLSEGEFWTVVVRRRSDSTLDTYAASAWLRALKVRVRAVSNRL